MKKITFICGLFLVSFSYQAFAKAGLASDEHEFVLIIVGFLLLVAGFFEVIDYLKKNGKALFIRLQTFLRNKILTMRNSH